jgi:hypothetical protein
MPASIVHRSKRFLHSGRVNAISQVASRRWLYFRYDSPVTRGVTFPPRRRSASLSDDGSAAHIEIESDFS